MHAADWTILTAYLVGTVFLGVFLGKLVKNASDLFAAGGQSPWWTSGLSAFMTMFSANTFVVWGGLAYQYGIVAIVVNMCYGVAAILAGYTVAGRWKKLGINTPAEYVTRRYGEGALHFYTGAMMIFRLVGSAGALYAIATLIVAVTKGDATASDLTGIPPELITAILIFGAVIIIYTMIGGLWAVLMTDVLQFIVLNVTVLFVIPLAIWQIGGWSTFVEKAPEGFFNLTAAKYTWPFLAGWVAIHYFMIGAEFAFVQRFLCVPTPKDARKSTFLFGGLYLFSPFLWLLPPLLWRVVSPIPADATPAEIVALKEQAYILSCKSVLPIGMLGLMLAAMFSATASMISSQLNVFSGVLANDVYRAITKRKLSDQQLLRLGRLFTIIIGIIITAIAIAVPVMGGAEKVIISITEVMAVPLMAPMLWGVLSKKVNARAVWVTAGICIPLGLTAQFGFSEGGFLESIKSGSALGEWFASNSKLMLGVILPVAILTFLELTSSQTSLGWKRLQAEADTADEESPAAKDASNLPAKIIGIALYICAATMLILLFVNSENRGILVLFSCVLATIASVILFLSRETTTRNTPDN